MTFGQLVIGQPGAGKSTYCRAAALALGSLYGRRCAIVNLDPANDDRHNAVDDTSDNSSFSGPAAISIHDLISLQDAMDAYGLGPNGGIMYCMEYLAANLDWLDARLAQVSVSDDGQGQQVYLLIDLPGQVELYAHHDAVRTVVSHLVRNGYRLCVTQLTDSSHLLDPYKSISSMLLSLQSMLHLELPHIHVLSKLDLTAAQSPPPRFFATASDPSRAAALLAANPTTPARYAKLAAALAEFVDDYSLVSYLPLCATDPACLRAVCAAADRAVGYYAANEPRDDAVPVAALVRDALDRYDPESGVPTDSDDDELYGREGNGANDGAEHMDEDWGDRWDRVQRLAAAGQLDGSASGLVRDVVER